MIFIVNLDCEVESLNNHPTRTFHKLTPTWRFPRYASANKMYMFYVYLQERYVRI